MIEQMVNEAMFWFCMGVITVGVLGFGVVGTHYLGCIKAAAEKAATHAAYNDKTTHSTMGMVELILEQLRDAKCAKPSPVTSGPLKGVGGGAQMTGEGITLVHLYDADAEDAASRREFVLAFRVSNKGGQISGYDVDTAAQKFPGTDYLFSVPTNEAFFMQLAEKFGLSMDDFWAQLAADAHVPVQKSA